MQAFLLLAICCYTSSGQIKAQSVVDEVIWVVGDEAILKSEVEVTRIQAALEGMRWNGDPDCAIPEQLAVQKLFLHQAAIDSIEVTEADVASSGTSTAASSTDIELSSGLILIEF